MSGHLLFVGGEDHNLRIPFMLAMQAQGFRVSAAASCDEGPFAAAGIEFHRFHFDRFVAPLSDWRAIKEIRRILNKANPDIVHCYDTKLTLLVPFAAHDGHDARIVRTINGRGWIYSSRSASALVLRYAYRQLHRFIAPAVSATVFEHGGDKSFFERYRLLRGGDSVIIKGAGIDCEGIMQAAAAGRSRKELREELGLRGAEVVITVTRVTRQKGIPTLLKAAELVHASRPNARFLIVGPRESEGPFGVTESELGRLPYVIATGPRSDVPSLLSSADLFAFPSEYAEGVPRALLEASLIGLPVVSTDLAGCRTAIRDGWNGFLVPPRDPRRLAKRIVDLLENREVAETMRRRGPAVVSTEFSLDAVVARHVELYQSQLAKTRSRRRPPLGADGRVGLEVGGG